MSCILHCNPHGSEVQQLLWWKSWFGFLRLNRRKPYHGMEQVQGVWKLPFWGVTFTLPLSPLSWIWDCCSLSGSPAQVSTPDMLTRTPQGWDQAGNLATMFYISISISHYLCLSGEWVNNMPFISQFCSTHVNCVHYCSKPGIHWATTEGLFPRSLLCSPEIEAVLCSLSMNAHTCSHTCLFCIQTSWSCSFEYSISLTLGATKIKAGDSQLKQMHLSSLQQVLTKRPQRVVLFRGWGCTRVPMRQRSAFIALAF